MTTGLRVLVALSCAAIAGEATASGFYNMPTNLQQCLGYGYGPGFHAPMLLGPMWKTRLASQRIKRIPHALTPPAQAGFMAPSVLEMPYASGGHGYGAAHGMPMTGYGYSLPMVTHQQPIMTRPVVQGQSMDYRGHEAVPATGPAR